MLALASGCASSPAPESITVPAGAYTEAFQSSKDVLRRFGFELDRVDARRGVLTTATRPSSGFATPWVPHSRGLGPSVRGFAHHEQRIATIEFSPIDDNGEAASPVDPGSDYDLRTADAPVVLTIRVEVQRLHRPGRRVSPSSVRLDSETDLPDLEAQPESNEQVTLEIRDDPRLTARLMRACAEAIGG